MPAESCLDPAARPRWAYAAAALLLAFFAAGALRTAWRLPPDVDERAYVVVGRLNLIGHGWAGDLAAHIGPVSLYLNQLGLAGVPDAELLPNPTEQHYHRARTGLLASGLFAGILTFLWSRRLFGPLGGLVSLALFCLNPVAIGYAGLANVDMTHAAATVLLGFALWRFLVRPRPLLAALLGAAFALALGTKFLAVLLAPVVGGAVLLRGGAAPPGGRPRGVLRWLLSAGLFAAGMLVVLHALYQFRGGFSPLDPAAYASARFQRLAALPGAGVLLCPWPWPLVRGIDLLSALDVGEGRVYLRGVFSSEHWDYYLWSVLVKTPEPLLAALGLGGVACAARWPRAGREERLAVLALALCVAVPLIALSTLVQRRVGIRYVLQLLPLCCVAAGALAPCALQLLRTRAARVAGGFAAAAAALFCAAEGLAASPNAIAYFNRAAGGEREAWRWFLDSNSDFGQYRGEEGPALLRARQDRPFEVLRGAEGPRFGRVAVYLQDLVTDPQTAGGGRHWVTGCEPVDHLDAAWWLFDATPEALAALADGAQGAEAARRREELAEAWWRAGEADRARAELARLPPDEPALLSLVLAWEEAQAAGRPDFDAALALAGRALAERRTGVVEGLLSRPGFPPSVLRTWLRARALEERQRVAEAVLLLAGDPELAASPELVLYQGYLLKRAARVEEARALLERHAELLAGNAAAARLRDELEQIGAQAAFAVGI